MEQRKHIARTNFDGFEKGRIISDAEPIILSDEQLKLLNEELKKETPITVGPLETTELFDLLQSKMETKLSIAFNTVEEFERVIDTGEIKFRSFQEKFPAIHPPYEEYTGPRLWREASLCQYLAFTVKGTIIDTPNDGYWVEKFAKWYQRQIDKGRMMPRVLGCFKIQLALYDPIDKVFISVNKEGTKYVATKTLITWEDVEKKEYKRNPPAAVLSNYNGTWMGGKKDYTAEEIMRFEKKTMYCLFAFPTVGSSTAVNFASSCVQKYNVTTELPYHYFNHFWNDLMSCTWFQYEGELADTVYDISEQDTNNTIKVDKYGDQFRDEATI